MQFWKMNVAGNDFILLNGAEEQTSAERLLALAKSLCTRRLSVGADGLAVLNAPKQDGDFSAAFYHAGGSAEAFNGNGLCCLCRFARENGICGETARAETACGIVQGQKIADDLYRVHLPEPTSFRSGFQVHVDERILTCSYVEFGSKENAHAVMEIQNLRGFNVETARQLCKRLCDSQNADVDLYDRIGDDRIYLRTYSKAAGDYLMSSGMGAAAAAYILKQQGKLTGNCLHVESAGGTLTVELLDDGLYLTAPTVLVAKGETQE